MTTTTATGRTVATSGAIPNGATLVAVAGFIGYAGLFLVRNFTDSFLELGIGAKEVDVSKDEIQQFSPSHYHVRSGQVWAWVAAVAAPAMAWPRARHAEVRCAGHASDVTHCA